VATSLWVAADAARAQGLGPGGPGGGGGGGGGGGLAGSLPTFDAAPIGCVLALLVASVVWRAERGAGWRAIAAGLCALSLTPLPLWSVLSLALVVWAAVRSTDRARAIAPAVMVGALGLAHAVDIHTLARLVAQLVGAVMTRMGVAVELVEATVHGPGGYVHVAPACVGLEGMVVGLALSTTVAMMAGATVRTALSAGAAHASGWAVLNVLRISQLGVLAQTDLSLAERTHDLGGVGMSAAHLVICGVTYALMRRGLRLPTSSPTDRSTGSTLLAGLP
jgi:exosortase/archaeosortase family protein